MIANQEIIFYILAAVIIALAFFVIRLEIRLRKLLRGKNAENLEGTIFSLAKEIDNLHKAKKDLGVRVDDINQRVKKSVKSVEIVRFNPFQESAGNQSFAISLLDEDGNGVVISSLYGRERFNVFTKPVEAYKSLHELTEEEKEVVERARVKMESKN